MYEKIESECLIYIRFNQSKLRSDEYIHLRHSVKYNIGHNLSFNEVGKIWIRPSPYIDSPHNMHH